MKKKRSILEIISTIRFLHIFLAILVGFAIGAGFLAIMGISVGDAYGKLLDSVTTVKGLSYVVVYATPYILTGLSVAFSFKTGVFNIGAEGQFVVGSMAAAVTGILLGNLPKPLLIPLCFLAAMLAGAIWGVIVGFLKTKWGINEVLAMIMFNWIAFYLSNFIAGLPGIKNTGTAEATQTISENARTLLSKTTIADMGLAPTANWGILMALGAMLLVWFIIDKTTLGYELKAVGSNRFAAEYGGIGVNKSILTALAISGALAGLGGALQVMGMGGRISIFSSQEGFGFGGIVVALIGCSNPFGSLAAGLFYGALTYGGSKLNLVGAPTQLISVIIGTVVFFIAISVIFERLGGGLRARKNVIAREDAEKSAAGKGGGPSALPQDDTALPQDETALPQDETKEGDAQ
ncbi:MAG: ABC transporter permease [Lachnospiraceae bacterium]|nr:ABC transporter permease [Lachnospiraceae bacterium]